MDPTQLHKLTNLTVSNLIPGSYPHIVTLSTEQVWGYHEARIPRETLSSTFLTPQILMTHQAGGPAGLTA